MFTSFSPQTSATEVEPRLAPTAASNPSDDPIAFYSDCEGNAEIYVMSGGGSNQQRLTYNDWDEKSPAWSSDGSHIAFASDRHDPDPGSAFPTAGTRSS
jgi:dipeptidyl aminopeptidase/acylaminoacyl peptidase